MSVIEWSNCHHKKQHLLPIRAGATSCYNSTNGGGRRELVPNAALLTPEGSAFRWATVWASDFQVSLIQELRWGAKLQDSVQTPGTAFGEKEEPKRNRTLDCLLTSRVPSHWTSSAHKGLDVHLLPLLPQWRRPRGLTFTWWGCCCLCFWHKPTKLAPLLFILFLCLFLSLWPFQL